MVLLEINRKRRSALKPTSALLDSCIFTRQRSGWRVIWSPGHRFMCASFKTTGRKEECLGGETSYSKALLHDFRKHSIFIIYSFIPVISVAPLQVHYCSEANYII